MLQADVYSRCNLGLSRIRAYAVWCAPGVRRVLARIRRAPGGVRRAYHPRRVGLGARSVAEAPGRRRGAEAPRAVHCVSWTSVRDFAGGAAIAAQRGRSAELETAAVPRLALAPYIVPRPVGFRRSVGDAARFARGATGSCAVASEERASASDLARSRICKASSASAPPVAEVGCVRPSAGTAVFRRRRAAVRARPLGVQRVCARGPRHVPDAATGRLPPPAAGSLSPRGTRTKTSAHALLCTGATRSAWLWRPLPRRPVLAARRELRSSPCSPQKLLQESLG